MPEPLVIRRVLGDQPFAQIGVPTVAARADAQGMIALGGDLGHLQLSGRDAGARWRPYRVGVFGLGDPCCRHLIRSNWPVLSLAFHPTLPLLTVGTGSYDGGYLFEGELLLLDLASGRRVSALDGTREVRRVRWLDDQRLELVMAPQDDYKDDAAHDRGHIAVVERADWLSVADRSIDSVELAAPGEVFPRPDTAGAAQEVLTNLCAQHGATWSPRRQIWAVEGLRDGRILAALHGVQLECWDGFGAQKWSVPTAGTGCQVHLSPDQQSAWVNVTHRSRPGARGWETPPSDVVRISLATGDVLNHVDIGYPVTLTPGVDGRFALRDTRHGRTSEPLRWFSPEGVEQHPVQLGGYDLFNHYFAVRHSPDPLFLQGDTDQPHRDKWIVTVREDQVLRLFPLDWEPEHRHLFGDPALRTIDKTGSALVHAGRVHDGQGLLRGKSFIARRHFPEGHAEWLFTCDHQATALDTDGTTVFAAYNSGELVALNSADGSAVWRQHLTVDGQPVDPLSMAVSNPGRLLIGTVDGRILDCTYSTPRPSKTT